MSDVDLGDLHCLQWEGAGFGAQRVGQRFTDKQRRRQALEQTRGSRALALKGAVLASTHHQRCLKQKTKCRPIAQAIRRKVTQVRISV